MNKKTIFSLLALVAYFAQSPIPEENYIYGKTVGDNKREEIGHIVACMPEPGVLGQLPSADTAGSSETSQNHHVFCIKSWMYKEELTFSLEIKGFSQSEVIVSSPHTLDQFLREIREPSLVALTMFDNIRYPGEPKNPLMSLLYNNRHPISLADITYGMTVMANMYLNLLEGYIGEDKCIVKGSGEVDLTGQLHAYASDLLKNLGHAFIGIHTPQVKCDASGISSINLKEGRSNVFIENSPPERPIVVRKHGVLEIFNKPTMPDLRPPEFPPQTEESIEGSGADVDAGPSA